MTWNAGDFEGFKILGHPVQTVGPSDTFESAGWNFRFPCPILRARSDGIGVLERHGDKIVGGVSELAKDPVWSRLSAL